MNFRYRHWHLIQLFCAIAALVPAIAAAQVGVVVTNAWARATVTAQTVGGVYMDIRSNAPARLLSATSPVAGKSEIHQMRIEGGVMKMTAIASVSLPAGKTVKLEPGGYHVMLMDLKRQLKAGDSVPLTLTFEGNDKTRHTVEIKAAVRSIPGVHTGH